jgi:ubiquinone/menaquinone biosynthesis C-methylase UbiE
MHSHDQNVLRQFDPQAQAYLTSAVHAAGPDLLHARALVQRLATYGMTALDAGCGAGHLSFAMAPLVAEVIAVDASLSMLDVVRSTAAERQMPQIRTQNASVEQLQFADAHFDIVASRYSAHHWLDIPAALRELRRVAKSGGYLLMIDLLGDESPLVDTHLQAMELLRDPSHVRDMSGSQWRAMIEEAGFELLEERRWPVRLEFQSWVARMRTPPELVAAIRALQKGAPREVQEGLALEGDGSFTPRTGLFWARAVS